MTDYLVRLRDGTGTDLDSSLTIGTLDATSVEANSYTEGDVDLATAKIYTATSISTTNVALATQAITESSAVLLVAQIVARKSGSLARGSFISSCLVYRELGGSATVEDWDLQNKITYGTFEGLISWDVSSNNARLLVNSGEVHDYYWKAALTVLSV